MALLTAAESSAKNKGQQYVGDLRESIKFQNNLDVSPLLD